MKCILVTGSIGSGKSEVCRYLAHLGYPVYDCDSRTKLLYSSVPGLKCTIEQALDIEWSGIGIIFRDKSKREKLESIVYPLLVEDIKAWKQSQSASLLFMESAIALDKPLLDALYDEVLLVKAPLELRQSRNPKVAQRDYLQQYDLSRVHYVIDNDGSLAQLYHKVDLFLEDCRVARRLAPRNDDL